MPAASTPLSRGVNIKDVAKASGVGIATVSRALNGQDGVSSATRERIQKIADSLGYHPNRHARFLKLTANRSIAVVIKGLENPLFAGILEQLEKDIRAQDYAVNIVSVPHYSDELQEAINTVNEDSVAGVIFLGARFLHDNTDIEKLTVPFVVSTVSFQKDEHYDRFASIAVDDYGEARRVVDYLYDLGHRRIALLGCDPLDDSVSSLRLQGYMEAMHDHGLEPPSRWIRAFKSRDDAPYSMQNGYHLTQELLRECPEITAIFSTADVLAIGAMRAIREAGLNIPKDISIIGFDGIPMASYLTPPLTTIRQPADEIAKTTCELLFSQIEGEKPRHVVLAGTLLTKDSTSSVSPTSETNPLTSVSSKGAYV